MTHDRRTLNVRQSALRIKKRYRDRALGLGEQIGNGSGQATRASGSSATMWMILIIGLMAGPAVSL